MRKRIGVKQILLSLILLLLCGAAAWTVQTRLTQSGETPLSPAPAGTPIPPTAVKPTSTPAPEEFPTGAETVSEELPAPSLPLPEPEIPAAMTQPRAPEETPEPLLPCSGGEPSLEQPTGPLAIYEVTLANGDAVEIRNISDGPVQLSGFYLSDKNKDRLKLQLPDKILEPGAFYVSKDLSLSVKGERIWLSDADENLLDYAKVSDLSVGGSYGRMEGESGWFYFAVPSLGEGNGNGYRRISERPQASLASGPYDDVESITVELSGPGVIHYTTDTTAPNGSSPVYTGPLKLNKTTIVRAFSVEEGALPSRVSTFHYLVNEHHTLPIVSFCSDDLGAWTKFYWEQSRFGEFAGNVALYENGEEVFNLDCGLRLKGFSAVKDMLKKNVGFYFRGRYGDGALEDCDLFHTGVTEYSSLIVRAGQDLRDSIIRNELMQELCLQASEHVPAQHSKYCIMYMNGQYRGIYCLKENMNEYFFADLYNVSPESFTNLRQLKDVNECEPLQEVINFCKNNDMSNQENYEKFCEMFDIDNYIDYILLEGFCGNVDFLQNVRYFYSDEIDGRWRFAFFDLDCCFYSYYCGMRVIFEGYAKKNYNVTDMSNALIKNAEFRDKLLRRYAEWIDGPLSPENVMREIDLLEAEILPEVPRDHDRIGIGVDYWEDRMAEVRSFATEDYIRATIDALCIDLNLTKAERAQYFGDR